MMTRKEMEAELQSKLCNMDLNSGSCLFVKHYEAHDPRGNPETNKNCVFSALFLCSCMFCESRVGSYFDLNYSDALKEAICFYLAVRPEQFVDTGLT